jgi:hypothetical protein
MLLICASFILFEGIKIIKCAATTRQHNRLLTCVGAGTSVFITSSVALSDNSAYGEPETWNLASICTANRPYHQGFFDNAVVAVSIYMYLENPVVKRLVFWPDAAALVSLTRQ